MDLNISITDADLGYPYLQPWGMIVEVLNYHDILEHWHNDEGPLFGDPSDLIASLLESQLNSLGIDSRHYKIYQMPSLANRMIVMRFTSGESHLLFKIAYYNGKKTENH